MTYIKFDIESDEVQQAGKITRSALKDFAGKIITSIIPKANPDFEHRIDEVKTWLVEFTEDDIPNREVGLNDKGEAIVIMSWGRNPGYWTDNNLTLPGFRQHFKTINISTEEFEICWNTLS